MNLQRSPQFETALTGQYQWYLTESNLDFAEALELAGAFADAVEETISFLQEHPFSGSPRVVRFSYLPGFHSWRVNPPFHRFLIFYRIYGETLFLERLLEGHRLLASNPE
jgi:hypothetical protein